MTSLDGTTSLPYQTATYDVNRYWNLNRRGIAEEDFNNAEVASNNQLIRDIYFASLQNNFNAKEAEKTRSFNAKEAEKTRKWQEELSNSEVQRRFADLKKAGINPIMAYASSASTPSGATASSSSASASGGRSSTHSAGRGASGNPLMDILSTVINMGTSLYTAGASNATKLAMNTATNAVKNGIANKNNETKIAIANSTEEVSRFKNGDRLIRRWTK